MRYNYFLKTLFVALAVFAVSFSQAQEKAKVKIRKDDNGQVEEFEKEINLESTEDIEAILKELNILDEFGNLEEGQAFEITVRKLDQNGEEQSYDLSFFPEASAESKAFLGVYIDTASGEEGTRGATVSGIIENTAAEQSDLQEGDIIVKLDRTEINSYDDLVSAISEKKAGEKVTLRYLRDGDEQKTKVTLGERPQERLFAPFRGEDFDLYFDSEAPEAPQGQGLFFDDEEVEVRQGAFLGVTPGECTNGEGVRIGTVIEESSAEIGGLVPGDVIKGFNGDEIHNWEELVTAIRSTQPGDQVTIEILRGEATQTISTSIGSQEYHSFEGINMTPLFKGTDEMGGELYDMQIELNGLGDDLQELMQGLEGMDELGEGMEELMEDLAELSQSLSTQRADGYEVDSEMTIRLEIDNITDEDLALVNENAEEQLKNANDLEMSNISFFPNPSSGQFALQFELPSNEPVRVMIFDQMGSIVYDEQINDFDGQYRNMLDLSDQADGVYYMQLMQGDKSYSKKLVKGS